MSKKAVILWSDEPSAVDLLAFGAVADTAVEAVLDDGLDPVAIGISGPWGSGKSTVLKLIKTNLDERVVTQEDQQVLVVETDPWRYDPTVGAKGTLIGEVLGALESELKRTGGLEGEAQNKLKKLAKRVNWVKAVKLAATTSLTLQLPSIENLSDLIGDEDTESGGARTLDDFKRDFNDLLTDDALAHIQRVIVLVDDLDRCLPDTVVDTLETMRLFLAVPKMSFVIAADEERVADALRERYPKSGVPGNEEEPAKLYLHKIVQTTFRLPALSRFDTEAFLLLLLLDKRADAPLDKEEFQLILDRCTDLRTQAAKLDELEPPDGVNISDELQFAARLTPILYEKLRGSPRRVKRFLNDLNVRSSIAARRGIELDIAVVAKLMILELLLEKEFKKLLGWLAQGELRAKLTELEQRAGRPEVETSSNDERFETDNDEPPASKKSHGAAKGIEPGGTPEETEFPDELIRWAKLPPALSSVDLSPYLHLAASFTSTPLIDYGLPERLRDIAASLLSSRLSQKSVSDADLSALTHDDAATLISHLGRMARDRPADLLSGIGGILRVAKLTLSHEAASRALESIPAKDITPPAVILFNSEEAKAHSDVLKHWGEQTQNPHVKKAVLQKLKSEGGS